MVEDDRRTLKLADLEIWKFGNLEIEDSASARVF